MNTLLDCGSIDDLIDSPVYRHLVAILLNADDSVDAGNGSRSRSSESTPLRFTDSPPSRLNKVVEDLRRLRRYPAAAYLRVNSTADHAMLNTFSRGMFAFRGPASTTAARNTPTASPASTPPRKEARRSRIAATTLSTTPQPQATITTTTPMSSYSSSSSMRSGNVALDHSTSSSLRCRAKND